MENCLDCNNRHYKEVGEMKLCKWCAYRDVEIKRLSADHVSGQAETQVTPHFVVEGVWEDSLISCLSQCYLNIKYKDKKYVIYLRWRWDDPWNAELIPAKNDNYEIDYKADWVQLFNDREFYTEEQLDECKKKAIENTIKYLQSAG